MESLTNKEIDEIGKSLGRDIPHFYSQLLLEIGYGESGDIELYHPQELDELYQFKFDDEKLLYKKYFPFGCNNRTGELWVIDIEQDCVASIYHETHEDDWPQENWREPEQWLLASKISQDDQY